MSNAALLKKLQKQLWLLGVFKIPMIAYAKPRLISIDDSSVKVLLKLRRRTKNHLNSMYFGALTIGADVAGGVHTFYYAEQLNCKVSFAFKGMSCEFIKRAESDCTFVCNDGAKVKSAMLKSLDTEERINETTHIDVFNTNNELVATFKLIVSVKCKN